MSEKQKIKRLGLDGLKGNKKQDGFLGLLSFKQYYKKEPSSVFFSKNGIVSEFFTEDSGLYFSPAELVKIRKGEKIEKKVSRFDSLQLRIRDNGQLLSVRKTDLMTLRIKKRYSSTSNYLADLLDGAVEGVSMAKMWNLSVIGAVIFGMFTMTMIYRYLGQNVSASFQDTTESWQTSYQSEQPPVSTDINDGIDSEYITRILENADSSDQISKSAFAKEIMDMVKGYPIEKMVPEIVKKDRIVAAFLIAIAKKESDWGNHVPVLNGEDCFNYWGYRGIRDKMGTGGHTCFESPKDAVDTVGERIEYLVSETKRNTPDKMVVWKCGYDCSWDNKTAVKKWISDVDWYFQKLNRE
jgi:hypothetical protein